jgi:hypothetical protein
MLFTQFRRISILENNIFDKTNTSYNHEKAIYIFTPLLIYGNQSERANEKSL